MSVNQTPGFVKPRTHTIDAFVGGKLSIMQPQKGFRAGVDSVLLGAAVPRAARTVLDLGTGAGVAALTAMAHNDTLRATMSDINPDMAMLAQANADRNGFSARCETLTLDVTLPGARRDAAGLRRDYFDVVIANPPFFAHGTLSPEGGRATARHMPAQALEQWVRTAISSAHGRGEIVFIHTAQALPILLPAFARALGDVAVLPICPRAGQPANRVLIGGRKGSRAPFTLLPPLALHEHETNGYTPVVEAIFRGRALFEWRNGRNDLT